MHWRIVRDRGHRDGDALIAPVVDTTWDCPVCGEENVERATCWQCTAERTDWVCPCGRKNRKGDTECSDCGSERPEE
jgi:transcription elongation factor Elf1